MKHMNMSKNWAGLVLTFMVLPFLPLSSAFGQCQGPSGADIQVTVYSCDSPDYDLAGNVASAGGGVVSSFKWRAMADNPGVSGESMSPQTSSRINDPLTNLTDRLQTVVYQVEATNKEGCTGGAFYVTINLKPRVEVTGCIACNDQINVTLNNSCSVSLTLDMVAEGDVNDKFSTCENRELLEKALEVIVYDGVYPNGRPDNIVEKPGVFNYVIQLKSGYDRCFIWEHCWGKVNAEDKTGPVVNCPKNVYGLVKTKTNKDNAEATVDGNYYKYEPGTRRDIDHCMTPGASDADADGYGGCDDNCWDPVDGFNYLVCNDIEKIYRVDRSWKDPKYAYFTGAANAQDACGATYLVGVADELTDYGCGESPTRFGRQVQAVIVRTFTYRDERGMTASCSQKIYFFRPYIILPDCKVQLDKCEYPDLTAGNAAGKINPIATKSAPYFFNGICERIYLTDHECNYTASYVDQAFPGPEGCGVKVIRTWTILDWCWKGFDYCTQVGLPEGGYRDYCFVPTWSNKKLSFEQHLVVEDKTAPTVTCPKVDYNWDGKNDTLSFSTGPFNCTAVVNPPRPEVTGECQDWTWEFELWGTVVDPKTGLSQFKRLAISSNRVVYGVSPGRYQIKYLVRDACNNSASVTCDILVRDQIEPVAICDDELNVSLGGTNTNAAGIARVSAADVDEGSWDNCGPVRLDVRREIEESCLETYTELVLNRTWPTDFKKVVDTKTGFTYYLSGTDTLIVLEKSVYYSWWDEAVFFTCCDASSGPTDRVTIELRATDRSGNNNRCWLDVLVEDKLPPRCVVHDKSIKCTDLDFDPANAQQVAQRFGSPEQVVEVLDNCGATISERVVWLPDNCGAGTIERIFTVTDNGGRKTTCTQTITVEEVNHYEVKFPGDEASAVCGQSPASDLERRSLACDILAVNRDTTRFEASGDECFKLLITYRVINWCEYDGIGTEPTLVPRDYDNDGILTEPTWVEVDLSQYTKPSDFVVFIYNKNAKGEKVLVDKYTFADYTGGKVLARRIKIFEPGYWEYSQLVKVYDNIAPEVEVATDDLLFCAYGDPQTSCGAPVTISFRVKDACTPNNTEVRSVRLQVNRQGTPVDGTGTLYTYSKNGGLWTIKAASLPEGLHTFIVTAADGCGNLVSKRIDFEVKDCKSPAPICISQLTVDLMPVDVNRDGRIDGGMNTVWATDFVASDIDDCNAFPIPRRVKYFAFKQKDLPNGDPKDVTLEMLNDDNASIVLACEDEGVQLVYVFALDAKGNFDYCAVMAIVQPGTSPNPCGPAPSTGSVSGLITTSEDVNVSGVNVQLSGQQSRTATTGNDGLYSFNQLETGYDYTVTPTKNDDALNGVSTFDLVLISKHILGTKPLDTPYKIIAADVNNSRTVTTADMIKLRKLILNVDKEMTNNRSWRFVRADYVFPDPRNPWLPAFPEVDNINDLTGDLKARDFIAVKIGDVNGNARANALQGDIRTVGGTLNIEATDQSLRAGSEYTVTFRADMNGIQGYQFTLNFDANTLELVEVLNGITSDDQFGIFAREGAITTSWNKTGTESTGNADSELFSLVLRAKADGQLSDLLSLNSRLTAAEAYDVADQTMDVVLDFGKGSLEARGFEVYQNTPNPFRGQTVIGFVLPIAGKALIKVSDVTGRMVKVMSGDFDAGYNEVRLNSADLGAAGVLFYTIEANGQSATRRMVVLE